MSTNARKNFSERLLDWRVGLVAKYVEQGSSVLDLGAGTGWVAKRLAERKDCQASLVDVLDCNETDLPHRVYDGRVIPHADKSFDVTLLVFVLHHSQNQEEILRESARVTRKRIVVVEDTPRNAFELTVDKLCDSLMSMQHGFATPATYRKIGEWKSIFGKLGLELSAEDVIAPFFPFYYTKAVFVLDL
jgi:ubiquinone/menaquinone biosynthesis C-methylase UbiE